MALTQMARFTRYWFFVTVILTINSGLTYGYQLTDSIAVSALLSGAEQCENLTQFPLDNSDVANICRGGLDFQPELTITPTAVDEIHTRLGFAAGNALNLITPFFLPPWDADLSDTIRHINGRNRSYLLTAWYKHQFKYDDKHSIFIKLGLIDAANILATNRYADDVYTQFFSGPLIFGTNFVVPSYDYGGVLQWDSEKFVLTYLMMNVGENREGNNFNYYAIQLMIRLKNRFGDGHYRFMVDTTNNKFSTRSEQLVKLKKAMISFDQELGAILGGWIRFVWQDQKAAVNFSSLYSGGINIKGQPWGRVDDNIGVGMSFLNGGNLDIKKAIVFEVYYRWVCNEYLSISPDVQYQANIFKLAKNNLIGLDFALRATIEV
jgi:Carbohydrate-selective porin, OprB family